MIGRPRRVRRWWFVHHCVFLPLSAEFAMKKLLLLVFVIAMLLSPASLQPARADLPGFSVSVWAFNWGGLWRREVRRREIARWYRHYHWRTDIRLWLSRRAEGMWITRQAITQFSCRSHCILRNPNGPGVWRIWRTYRATDIRRFWVHYRITWVGHINPVVADAAPPPGFIGGLNQRYTLTQDHVEIVTPMEPEDPTPGDGVNEAVMVMDENGQMHFLGEPGFEQMPDTAENPNGFGLITTELSEHELPPPGQRIIDPPPVPMPGMAMIQPGVMVEWLADQEGQVMVDRDMNGIPDPILSAGVLGSQKHQGLIDQPQPTIPPGGEVEIDLDEGNVPLQLHCWELNPDGTVRGAIPGQAVIGPPVDLNGDGEADLGTAIGGPIPANPTVRDEHDVLTPGMDPVDFGIVQEGEPTPVELNQFNQALIQAGFNPIFPPFQMCIRAVRNRHFWSVDRRFVMDVWQHHWWWYISHHFNLTAGAHRIWITRAALSAFGSSHHHFVVGRPPQWSMYSLVHVRFFRVCYRVYCPRPNQIRVKIDRIYVVVPLHPEDPQSDLMLLTTHNSENQIFAEVSPEVLAGIAPDPFPAVQVIDIDPVLGTLDAGGGGTGVFDGDLAPLAANPGTMQTIAVVGNDDFAAALRNNQLQLYCYVLDANGNLARESFPPDCSRGVGCQLPDRRGHGPSGTLAARSEQSPAPVNIRSADNFLPWNNGEARSLCWWGINITNTLVNCGPGSDPFLVTYFADAAGLPGPVVGGPFTVNPTVTPTGNVITVGTARITEYAHEASHPPVPLIGGQRYWVEIVKLNNSDPSCRYFWQTAPAGDNRSALANPPPYVATPYDLAFCVDVQTGSLVTRGTDAPVPNRPHSDDEVVVMDDTMIAEDAALYEKLKLNDPNYVEPPRVERGPGPVNDSCANAIALSPPATISGTTIGATTDSPPAPATCGVSLTAPGVWYFVVGNGNRFVASLCDPATTYDTKLFVYRGTCSAPICVDGDDDACGLPPGHSRVRWCTQAGEAYFILVSGFSTQTGNFVLSVTDTGVTCGPTTLTIEGTPAMPVFVDDMGVPMPNPTMLSLVMQADVGGSEACCFADGTCQDLTAASCTASGGTPQGPGTACASTVCPLSPCPGDVNGNRRVGLSDIAGIISCWGLPAACNPGADQSGDGLIGLADVAVVLTNWGCCCPGAVPACGPGEICP